MTGLAVEVPEAIRPYVSLCCGRSRTLAQAISTTPEVIAWLPRSGLAIVPPGLHRGGGAASVPVWMSGGVVCAGRYEQRSEALGGGVRYLVDRRTAEMRRMGGSVASGLIATPGCVAWSMMRGRRAIPSPAATSACAIWQSLTR